MKVKLGILCMILGATLVLSALGLFLHNQQEAQTAEQATVVLLPKIVEKIEEQQAVQPPQAEAVETIVPNIPESLLPPEDLTMTAVDIDGHGYIGYLSIAKLGLELPVMSDWDYDKLKIAPCRYYGTLKGDDLVIMAHNYVRHFKSLSKLAVGDDVVFVDMDGKVTKYEVAARDVLAANAVDEMTAGAFDLTLFTCTYSGQERVTVYCDRAVSE